MYTSDDVAIAFCTFNPPAIFPKKVEEWLEKVPKVIVVEDGPSVIADLPETALLVSKESNLGIADSVNRAIELSGGQEWLLLFDQDTEIEVAYLDELLSGINRLAEAGTKVGALGAGRVGDLNYSNRASNSPYVEVDEIIQSATAFSLSGLRRIGGADSSLVIDAVDTDICLKLRRAGYWVGVDQNLHITHPIGSGRTIKVFGRTIMLSEHAPFRRYYMTRNRLVMLKRHGAGNKRWSLVYLRRAVVSTLLSITVERNRLQNLKAVIRGSADGFRGRLGKRDFS